MALAYCQQEAFSYKVPEPNCSVLPQITGCPSCISRQTSRQRLSPLRTGHPRLQLAVCQARAKQQTPEAAVAEESLTKWAFKQAARQSTADKQAGGAGGGTTYEALQKADAAWAALRSGKRRSPPRFVREERMPLPQTVSYDLVISGGTLGIFLACALQLRGLRVAVVERGPLRGRSQEWNISRKELAELVDAGLLTEPEAEECIGVEFNPVRAGFHGSSDVWTRDVLNLGVRPDKLIARVRQRFEAAGGRVYDFTAVQGVAVHPNGIVLDTPAAPAQQSIQSTQSTQGEQHSGGAPSASERAASGNGASVSGSSNSNGSGSAKREAVDRTPGGSDGPAISSRLLIDCMGNFSPIVQQARKGQTPDGVCLVVGSCCRGFEPKANITGDVIYTNTDTQPSSAAVPDTQYFWEAFPAGSAPGDRTTYMFSYMDARPERPSLEAMMEDYWRLMPPYQGVDLQQLQPLRILFGFFPTYRASPLAPAWDRIMQVGDASGIQSPLSFGGFGAMTRHLGRLTNAIEEALQADALDKHALGAINPYNPGLSSAWMLQRAMSVRPGHAPEAAFINTLLGQNFAAMQARGDAVLRPFLQDVLQFGPLTATLLGQVVSDPLFMPQIFKHVGILPLLDWSGHYAALGAYTALHSVARPACKALAAKLPPKQRYGLRRQMDAWEFGSGLDYKP